MVGSEEQPRQKIINFSSARSRQQIKAASGKTKQRSEKLLNMIQLDLITYELLDMSPIPYESLMKAYGQTNAVQSATQTGDPLHESCQTEAVEVRHRSTQHPKVYFGVSSEAEEEGTAADPVEARLGNLGSLNKFLKKATQLMLDIIEEETAAVGGGNSNPQKDAADYLAFSASVVYVQASSYGFLHNLPVTLVCFAPDQTELLLTVHRAKDGNGPSYILLWNVNIPGQAKTILVCETGVTCCCYPVAKSTMVFAGTEDGTVCLWDVRGSESDDVTSLPEWLTEVAGVDQCVLLPTFVSQQSCHMSKVTCITALQEGEESSGKVTASSSSLSGQVASTDDVGSLIIWTVLDEQEESDVDLGLAHWGRVRMVATEVVDLQTHFALSNSIGTYCVGADAHSVFVGTDAGLVLNFALRGRAQSRPGPRTFKADVETSSACRSLNVCPFGRDFLLVGCDDGCVRLHSLHNERPLITWQGTVDEAPIATIVWSMFRPCVFFVLDSKSRIHLWDLGAGDIYPAHTVQLSKVTRGLASSGVGPALLASTTSQSLALACLDGSVQVHRLKPEYVAEDGRAFDKELNRFLHYVSII